MISWLEQGHTKPFPGRRYSREDPSGRAAINYEIMARGSAENRRSEEGEKKNSEKKANHGCLLFAVTSLLYFEVERIQKGNAKKTPGTIAGIDFGTLSTALCSRR
jgi:hypothetical protein